MGLIVTDTPRVIPGYEHWERLPAEIRQAIPLEDAWAIDPEERRKHFQEQVRRRRRLARYLASGVDVEGEMKALKGSSLLDARKEFRDACAVDPVFLMENVLWARDPENRMGCGKDLPLVVMEYARKAWIENWLKGFNRKPGEEVRWAMDKTRRLRMSIYLMAMEFWAFHFVPGSIAWIAREKESMVDNGKDWNSLLGKFRYFQRHARRYYPWMIPDLPDHTEWNQQLQLRYPERMEGGTKGQATDERLWGNELIGATPSTVGSRGGAASRGRIDEAAHSMDLPKYMDEIQDMTPDLALVSTPSEDKEHYFAKCVFEMPGWTRVSVHWKQVADRVQGIRWEKDAEWRGEWTQRWRTKWYEDLAETRTSQEIAKNHDLDYESTAGSRIFLNFRRDRVCGSTDPRDPTYDYYDKSNELQVWYDPGRGDPWALIWVQLDKKNGWVNIVDFWMKADITVHWWVPLLLGWPTDRMDRWLTAPEALPWSSVVPWGYTPQERRIIERWSSRRYDKGGRISIMNGDYDGAIRSSGDLYSVEERLMAYGIPVQSVPSSWKRNVWLEKADEVLLRTRISGFLVGMKPGGIWPSIDETFAFWRRQSRSEKSDRPAKPRHDAYSHAGSAWSYGSHLVTSFLFGRIVGEGEDRHRVVYPQGRPGAPDRVQLADPVDRATGWM